jgi:hypothetical protein
MKEELANQLVDMSWGDGKVYEGYSGRGMYGRETTGVVFPDLGSFECTLERYNEEEFGEDWKDNEEGLTLDDFRKDNLGLQVILY